MFSELIPAINAHVLAEFPKEACGVIYHNGERPVFLPCANEHPDPEHFFRISGRITAPLLRDRKLVAVIHSHTNGNFYPSASDMRSQQGVGVPYAIALTEGENVSPLLWFGDPTELCPIEIPPINGRQFVSGVYDCYSIIRHHYLLELGITLKDYPRDPDWWEAGGNLYMDFVEDAGFVPIELSDVQKHDVVFMHILSDIPNHACVYLGNDRIVHHLGFRLSHSEDPLGKWHKQIHSAWRHHSLVGQQLEK